MADTTLDPLAAVPPPHPSELPRRVDKPWGHEEIWAHTDKYVGKILELEAGRRSSDGILESRTDLVVSNLGYVVKIAREYQNMGVPLDDLLNELRNAGAEAISVDGVRIVSGVVVAGAPGGLSVENHAIGDSFEIRAIGSPQILTGTLTRTGGVIAQIGATYPIAQLTVTPADRLTLPATDRTLLPTHGQPRL